MTAKYPHYHKPVGHLQTVDVYRVLELFEVAHPAVQHAVKKLLCAGQRGGKDFERDLREAGDSINRALQMIAEDCSRQTDHNVSSDELRSVFEALAGVHGERILGAKR